MDFEMKIWNLPKTEKEAIIFFQDKELLPTTKQCGNGRNMTLIYCWVYELINVAWYERELGISKKTAIHWNNCLCKVCMFSMQQKNCGKIGGIGYTVGIDESLFTKRKNNAEKSYGSNGCLVEGVLNNTQVPSNWIQNSIHSRFCSYLNLSLFALKTVKWSSWSKYLHSSRRFLHWLLLSLFLFC